MLNIFFAGAADNSERNENIIMNYSFFNYTVSHKN